MLFREAGLEDDFEVEEEIERLTSTKNNKVVRNTIINGQNVTRTVNGDIAYKSTGNNLIDILFQSNWLRNHTEDISIGTSEKERVFSMFMRDPRFGIGEKNVGRQLLKLTGATMYDVYKCGRTDDIWRMFYGTKRESEAFKFLYDNIIENNQLVKKWMPRFAVHNTRLNPETQVRERCEFTPNQLLKNRVACKFADTYGLNKQQYKKLIKASKPASYVVK